MKGIGKVPVSMRCYRASHLANVRVKRQFLRAKLGAVNAVLLRKFIADRDFLIVRKTRQPHWNST